MFQPRNIAIMTKRGKRKHDSRTESDDVKKKRRHVSTSVPKELSGNVTQSSACGVPSEGNKTHGTELTRKKPFVKKEEKREKIKQNFGGNVQKSADQLVKSSGEVKSDSRLTDTRPVQTVRVGGHEENREASQGKRKPLTARQLHKKMKLKLKRQEKRLGKKERTKVEPDSKEADRDSVTSSRQTEIQSEVVKNTKIILPKTSDAISSNWKNLKSNLDKEKEKKLEELKKKGIPIRPMEKTLTLAKKEKPSETEKEPEIWFDDVDDIYLDRPSGSAEKSADMNPLVKLGGYKGLTNVVSMDCEMVGVGDGREDMLARVSIVNKFGEEIYDKFVKPREEVVDYRTHVSGVRPEDLEKAEDFMVVQKEVADILKGRILVGHAVRNDLRVLYLSHPSGMLRDTSRYKPFRQLFNGRTPSLKKLTAAVLKVAVQDGEHNSVQDAQAAMRLYTFCRQEWEKKRKSKHLRKLKAKNKAAKARDKSGSVLS